MREAKVPAGSTYEVVLPGRFTPALLASLASSCAGHATVTSVLLVPTARHTDISEVVERLEQRGLDVLDVRRLESPAQSSAPEGA
jgi:hypothetical protein